MKPDGTLYDVLEVSQRARLIVVKAAYRALAQSLHPDKNSGTQVSGERLAAINAAYSILSDPAKRLHYDQSLGLNPANTERRGNVPAGERGDGHFCAGNKGSRPFAFRPLN